MSKIEAPKLVTALFTFKGTNNDELCFRKGDIITITQIESGGWWEGTLNDKTGWFPSNYVKEYRALDAGHSSVKSSPEKTNQESPSPIHQRLNRDIVLKDFVESERANVAELQGLVNNFLQPLELTTVLKKEEYKQLVNNFNEVLEVHQRLLANLEAVVVQGPDARVGNLFLTLAPRLKTIHLTYCNGHPQAVCIMDQYRDELNDFMERSGAVTPGILVLTTGLSKPFRRLEKYSALLQELERHTEKNHSDRGDTQRSVCVYRDIGEKCTYARKQKELALQILTSGVKGWEGEELNSLGEILHVGPVTLAMGSDRRDRYFVLFPTTLLVLSTSARMSSFVYEGKLPLTSIDVISLDDTEDVKNAFEITGPMIESIIVVCGNREERQQWIDYLTLDQSTSGLLRSPTMSHVSCSHPFARLSRFYAKLVRKKIIYPELIKKLLYLQYIYKPDLSNVKMRKCIVTYEIYTSNSGNLDSEDEKNLLKTEGRSTKMNLSSDNLKNLKMKSSLMLDVRYVENDLTTHSAHLPVLSPMGDYEKCEYCRPTTFDNFQSLHGASSSSYSDPSTSTNLKNLPSKNVVLATISPDNSNEIPPDEKNNNDKWNSPLKTWKSFGGGMQRNLEISSEEFIHIGKLPSVLMTISENVRDSNEGPSGRQIPPSTSLHSSDSGMADSYHMTSSELNSYRYCPRGRRRYLESLETTEHAQMSHSESENDENKFEHQCICSSPFGSTPRESQRSLESSESANNSFIAFIPPQRDNIKLKINNNSNAQNECNSEDENSEEESSVLPKEIPIIRNEDKKRYTEPIPYEHQNICRKVGRHPIRPKAIRVEEETTLPVYTSGLYAHWWLKKTIPLDPASTEQDEQSLEREIGTDDSRTLFVTRD